ncbi:TetR/AcrR family transcriptional regulator [Gordonia alkanivorans]|uniref:TetR/AcrR family transcriptional regulator n=1 Tax=Gordonia alkanivorans TaxID=84096 RepID=UPI000FDEBCCB|nr:TetR/AcrR family transcriptional regulator [Gordonia alkanivorans]AZZ83680.1 TetR/AcrR family transcriptional regulator [Gordonia alkanivorans]MDH3015416.1 TetR/AcrR family transcriptional regulator [Gordonia alkanivorans]MDH3040436.1 TetR/AcrR family transcriptional regulator [Gordonia alkanivorans]MDH3060170.1 TetR/AcrR family transcriptional regulator [Gordonia alkanivorans]
MDPQQRRKLILDRSAAIFARKGVSATTIREIADAVGVHSGALYHYFPSKEAIVTEIMREYILDLSSRCEDVLARRLAPVERLVALAEIALETNEQYDGATSIWRREGDYMRERVVEADMTATADLMEIAWREAIAEGVDLGEFRTDIDPRVFQELIYDAVWHASRWFRPTPENTLADLARTIITVFVSGMRNPAASATGDLGT